MKILIILCFFSTFESQIYVLAVALLNVSVERARELKLGNDSLFSQEREASQGQTRQNQRFREDS